MHRTARYAWGLGLSLGLHAWLLYLAWPTPSKQVASSIVYVTARLKSDLSSQTKSERQPALTPTPQAHSEESLFSATQPPRLSGQTPAPISAAAKSFQARLPDRPPLSRDTDATTSSATAADPHAPQTDGYYPFEDVDQAATPIGDWLIDGNVLPRGASVRVELWLWISASGKIDRWELAPATPINGELERALAELDQTAVQPALRNNIAVPSFRRLEVFISRD